MGCYLAPGNRTTIQYMEAEMAQKPRGMELIIAGGLNVDLGKEVGWVRDKEITVAVATPGLDDIAGRFFLRQRTSCQDQRTCAKVRQGRVVRSRTDYILGSDRWIFQNVAARDPRHNSNHFMVVRCLSGASPREHSCYLGCRTRLPLRLPGRHMRTREDKLFAELRSAVSKPDKRTARCNSCISEETWRIVDKRVSTSREPGRGQRRLRQL